MNNLNNAPNGKWWEILDNFIEVEQRTDEWLQLRRYNYFLYVISVK